MKKFWKKSTAGSNRSLSSSNNSSNAILNNLKDNDCILSKKQPTKFVTTSVPTRNQRMQLLSSVIHHADAVQSQFAPPKSDNVNAESNSSSTSAMIKSLTGDSAATIKHMNEKAYIRWQHVLQEGLVPMAVRGLGLLETIEVAETCKLNDEEDQYFTSLEGMDEEIRMMAILGRAASLRERNANNSGSVYEEPLDLGEDGMEQINSMMKCTAMIMFHIVMMASTPSPSPSSQSDEAPSKPAEDTKATQSAAGYDGRVRHVLKMSCVDLLTRAIIESIETYEKSQTNSEHHEAQDGTSESKLYDIDEYTLWNIPNIKTFVDKHTIGKGAIFGDIWNKKTSDMFGLLGKKQGGKHQDIQPHQKEEETEHFGEKAEETPIAPSERVESEEFPSIEEMHSDLLLTDEMDEEESAVGTGNSDTIEVDDESDQQAESEKNKTKNDQCSALHSNEYSSEHNQVHLHSNDEGGKVIQEERKDDSSSETPQERELRIKREEREAHIAKRQLNAKFLASRKYELIERIVAIDVVRFLMAEERERKLREREQKEQKSKFMNVVEMLKKSTEDDYERENVVEESVEGETLQETDNEPNQSSADAETSTEYWSKHRKKQVLRSLKIAGVGLTLGTVFAVTGGLAAPALAAGIGGLASLTGAGTASSTAILAVLATFKAGAALFGVGGGGLAAYKMKKRTDGLSDFSIRRENIEQYMYPGASDAKMKKGIEAMLPHLHTTVAVSGWLRENDVDDFQLAWGVCPYGRDEKTIDDAYRVRQLKRFYSVYNPQLVQYCEDFMWYLHKKQNKEFSWEKIWSQLEAKYGTNPDHMLPIDKPYNDEIFLSTEERELIDGVLNNAKVAVGKQRGFLGVDIDFNENDEIREFLEKVSPTKENSRQNVGNDFGTDLVENLEERMMNENIADAMNNMHRENDGESVTSGNSSLVDDYEHHHLEQPAGINNTSCTANYSEDDAKTISTDGNCHGNENANNSTNISITNSHSTDNDGETQVKEDEDQKEERCPIVWDWTRLYGSDLHTVTWESKMLSSLCHIVENIGLEVSSQATKAALQFSIVGAIISAVALPSALLTASKLIDDPYQIVVIRADEAGKELAKCLLMSDERRPVTLVGFSFGARVIYSCLRELARQQDIWEEERSKGPNDIILNNSSKSRETKPFQYDREPASLIADVIFIGLPRIIDKAVLTSCRRVTGGRFINCYTKNDWLLSLMFVARGGSPCGIKPILDVPGVENYDVTSLVETHTKYADAIPNILKMVRFCEP